MSSRAAKTAREPAMALVASLSLRKHNAIGDGACISFTCDLRPVGRSLAVCGARDDNAWWSHWKMGAVRIAAARRPYLAHAAPRP